VASIARGRGASSGTIEPRACAAAAPNLLPSLSQSGTDPGTNLRLVLGERTPRSAEAIPPRRQLSPPNPPQGRRLARTANGRGFALAFPARKVRLVPHHTTPLARWGTTASWQASLGYQAWGIKSVPWEFSGCELAKKKRRPDRTGRLNGQARLPGGGRRSRHQGRENRWHGQATADRLCKLCPRSQARSPRTSARQRPACGGEAAGQAAVLRFPCRQRGEAA
jgi:hypothetical protein